MAAHRHVPYSAVCVFVCGTTSTMTVTTVHTFVTYLLSWIWGVFPSDTIHVSVFFGNHEIVPFRRETPAGQEAEGLPEWHEKEGGRPLFESSVILGSWGISERAQGGDILVK